VRQLKEAFTLLDSDGNGTVSSQDLAEMMVSLGFPADAASEAEATRMLALMPQPLTFSSFLTGMSGLLSKLSSVADLNQAFTAFEDDAPATAGITAGRKHEGRIHVDELRELLVESGMNEADVNQCFKSFTKPGGLSGDWFYYKDFISLVKGDEEDNGK
jgi:Ca2+-binding EF-hand superfamily protein